MDYWVLAKNMFGKVTVTFDLNLHQFIPEFKWTLMINQKNSLEVFLRHWETKTKNIMPAATPIRGIKKKKKKQKTEVTTRVYTSATLSGPPSSSISSSRVLGGKFSASSSSFSRRSFFIFWACSTASWLVRQLSWTSALTYEQTKKKKRIKHTLTLKRPNQSGVIISERVWTCLPGAAAVGAMTGAVKAGLVEPNPEANKALWMESGSILFLLFFFFFFSFPFFGSFLISQGSKNKKKGKQKGLLWWWAIKKKKNVIV